MEVRRNRRADRDGEGDRATSQPRLNSTVVEGIVYLRGGAGPSGPALQGIFLLDRDSLLMEGGRAVGLDAARCAS